MANYFLSLFFFHSLLKGESPESREDLGGGIGGTRLSFRQEGRVAVRFLRRRHRRRRWLSRRHRRRRRRLISRGGDGVAGFAVDAPHKRVTEVFDRFLLPPLDSAMPLTHAPRIGMDN